MSGIAGICSLDGGPADPSLLRRMTAAMAHRGPDGEGYWVEGSVGLGHSMLHTTPESVEERQPWSDESGRLQLVLDGRVDNREELRRSLAGAGARLRNATDAELILRAYELWGTDCPLRIIGDFAFAIWDSPSRQLFCVRDPLGMKPLYYSLHGRSFMFASEMQPFFQDPTLERRPNLPLVGVYLLNRFDEREETLYEGIYSLPPGHSLILRDAALRKSRYWDADPSREVRYGDDVEYAEHFLELFREAVGARLRSSGPVAALLSGGLDSSSIAATAQVLYDEGVVPIIGFETFSIAFDEFSCDERKFSGEVVRQSGIPANYFIYEQQDLSFLALERAGHYPDVFYEPVIFLLTPMYEAMQQRGFKVFLDGLGGDELLAPGFEHLTDLMRMRRFRDLARQLRSDALLFSTPPASLFVNYCLKPLLPAGLKAILRPAARALRRDDEPSLLRPDFVSRLESEGRLNGHAGAETFRRRFPHHSQQQIYDSLFFGWNATVVCEQVGRLASRFSLEGRSPFKDRRVVEFVLGLPPEQRWWRDETKAVLRRAMKGILPEAVRSRRGKAEFSAPIDRELKHRQGCEVERIFQTSILADWGVLDRWRLLDLFARYRNGTREYLTGRVELALAMELWCRGVAGATAT